MQRMETVQKDKKIERRLLEISRSLNKILEELQSEHYHKLSKKAQRSIEKNLADLRAGKGVRYRSVAALDRALS